VAALIPNNLPFSKLISPQHVEIWRILTGWMAGQGEGKQLLLCPMQRAGA